MIDNSLTKLAAIHSCYVKFPEEAEPYNRNFDSAAPQKYVNSNIDKTLSYLHQAGSRNVDLVCTHEDFKGSCHYIKYLDHPELFSSLVEEIPGPTSNRISEIAKMYKMYIAANYYEKSGDEIFNTTVLIGREGEIAGKYRKVHIADGERWRVTGGEEFPVFETDIGIVGFAICYDIFFPEHSRSIALNGANIIIHQTQGWGTGGKGNLNKAGEAMVLTRAAENCAYLVVAKNINPDDNGKSCIIDNYSNILAEASGCEETLVIAEFEPDFGMVDEYNVDNFYSDLVSNTARYLLARRPSLYSGITKDSPAILEQYKGIELQADPEKDKAIFRKWRNMSESEKLKYHG